MSAISKRDGAMCRASKLVDVVSVRRQVMKIAWSKRRENGAMSMAEAMREAWIEVRSIELSQQIERRREAICSALTLVSQLVRLHSVAGCPPLTVEEKLMLGAAIEAAIQTLDTSEADPDLEPSLCGAGTHSLGGDLLPSSMNGDDREEENEHGSDEPIDVLRYKIIGTRSIIHNCDNTYQYGKRASTYAA